MGNYYILDEQQYIVLMKTVKQVAYASGIKVPDDIFQAEVCGRKVSKAELNQSQVAFIESDTVPTYLVTIEGRFNCVSSARISQEAFLDHPDEIRQYAHRKICEELTDKIIEKLIS